MSFRKLASFKKRVVAAVYGKQNVHFLHLRKTGGTTIKNALSNHQITGNSVIYLHPHRITLKHVPRGHRIMFATRDAATRYVSGFNSRLRKGAPAHHVPWSPDEELAFSRFTEPNSLALALDPGHPRYPEALHAMASISHIRSSYWDWFVDEKLLESREKDILFIGQVETFDADFEALKPRLGLPPSLQLPQDAKSTHRSGARPAQLSALEPAAVELIRQWYKQDYKFLEFCSRWRERNGGPLAKV